VKTEIPAFYPGYFILLRNDIRDDINYNKLNMESKRFQNIMNMICYRAERACVNLLSPGYAKSDNEKKALVKSIINSHADILPDYKSNQLTLKLYSVTKQTRE